MVVAASTPARATRAPRQPSWSTRALVKGWKMKLASPATRVTAVMARRWFGAVRLASTVNAGSYSTAAMASPIATQAA